MTTSAVKPSSSVGLGRIALCPAVKEPHWASQPSTAIWILVLRPPRERPMA